MADVKYTKAKAVFDTTCEALRGEDWRFTTDDEELKIHTQAIGEDLPMDIMIDVNAKRQLVLVISKLPLTVPENKLVDLAIAVNVINYQLVDGSFDFDLKSGRIFFRLTSSFRESKVGKEAVLYMLMCSCKTIDEYNDKLLLLAKGLLDIDQFVRTEMD